MTQLAEKMDTTKQGFHTRFKKASEGMTELELIFDEMGYDLELIVIDRTTGEKI